MDIGAEAVALRQDGDRVVEVLRSGRIDRERGQSAEIDSALERRLGQRVWLEGLPLTPGHEKAFEHGLDPVGRSEHSLDLRAAAARPDDGEVARTRVAKPLPVDDERDAGSEERLADDEPPSPADLDDGRATEILHVPRRGESGGASAPSRRRREGARLRGLQRLQLEGQRVHVTAPLDVPEDRRQDDLLADQEQDHGRQ